MKKPSPTQAVALAYREGMQAPTVVARGQGHVAEQILARARQAGIYVHESSALVALLSQVDLDHQIPPTLYLVIAELLAWIHQIEMRTQPIAKDSPHHGQHESVHASSR